MNPTMGLETTRNFQNSCLRNSRRLLLTFWKKFRGNWLEKCGSRKIALHESNRVDQKIISTNLWYLAVQNFIGRFPRKFRGGVTFYIIAILNQSSYFKRYSRRLLLKTLTLFFVMFLFDPAENRDQKGILGRKGLTAFDVIKRLSPTILYNVNEDIA